MSGSSRNIYAGHALTALEGIGSQNLPGSPLRLPAKLPDKMPYPQAAKGLQQIRPPAVRMPYNRMGRSGTGLAVCNADGRFGPFDGRRFVAEFTEAKVIRVFLEMADGECQGAAFPFLAWFASGLARSWIARTPVTP